jgi:Cytochrome c554 and c-prime
MRRVALMVLVVAAVALLLGAASTQAQEHEYIGAAKCKKCHLKQYKSWEATTMAKSFEALKPGVAGEAKTAAGLDPNADYTADPKCVGCHVTGFGKPGGFVDFATTPELANVGCESCHGAGGTYTQDGKMTLDNKEYVKADIGADGLVAEVGEAQCVTCHNKDNPFVDDSFVFDYEANKDKGVHEHFPLKYTH